MPRPDVAGISNWLMVGWKDKKKFVFVYWRHVKQLMAIEGDHVVWLASRSCDKSAVQRDNQDETKRQSR